MDNTYRGFHHRLLIWAMRVPKLNIYLFSRTLVGLHERHVGPVMSLFSEWSGKFDQEWQEWVFQNGSKIHLCTAPEEKDVFWYAGNEMDLLVFDEPDEFMKFQFDYLRTRVRSTVKVPVLLKFKLPGIILGNEPVGRWVDVLGLGHD